MRSALPSRSTTLLRLLSAYAGILENIGAVAEADAIRAEALGIVRADRLATLDAVEAHLKYGQLQCRMKNYDPAIANLKEAARLVEGLDDVEELRRQIVLAEAWRSLSVALEALGEFSQASDALDVLTNVKRAIRFLVFSNHRRP